MICLGCLGGRKVLNPTANSRTAYCFRCKGSGKEPQSEIDFVNAINAKVRAA